MKKRLFILLAMAILFILPGHAVLKEHNLDTTLVLLRSELTNYHIQLEKDSKKMKAEQTALLNEVIDILGQANQNSIMLYSQKDGYIFDMAYACHEATEQYHKFKDKSAPFNKRIAEVNFQVARYDSLILNLQQMPEFTLSDQSKLNRNVCLTLAVNIRKQLKENQDQVKGYVAFYERAEARLKTLNDYADQRYADIQSSIFNNKGQSFFKILTNLFTNVDEAKQSVSEKYRPSKKFMSQWDVRIISFLFATIFIYGFISIALNVVIVRIIITQLIKRGMFARIKEEFMAKRTCIMMAMMVVTFALLLGIVNMTWGRNQYFIKMASGLLVEYAWLLGVILISLLLRVKGSMIKSSFRIYSPIIVMGFIVIAFRIILIPNDLVNLIFPPMLLLCAIWQWFMIRKHRQKVEKSDMIYAWISLIVFAASVITSWAGRTLLSVQILIWWVMQLTCILSITCVAGWIKTWAINHDFANKDITQTWLHRMIYYMILPILAVYSFIISIYWASDVFNLSDTTWELFAKKFVDTDQIQLSLFNITQVIVLFFIFKYLNRTLDDLMKLHFERQDKSTAASRYMMSKNVLQILCWGIWLLVSISICHISNTWFVVISGGLSTGVGFAMKDILENIYYGISLMSGRIKIGDYIVCDGIRGRVSNISYTSTMLEAIDGSVIAFTNSQLFTKNYKNMTKNHGYELDSLEVGVAYGTNIKQTKAVLVENIMKLDCIQHEKGVRVLLKSFDDSCITLRILVWVNVLSQAFDDAKIMECIYKTLNENNIEIPFPQRVVTLSHLTEKPVSVIDDEDNDKEADGTSKVKTKPQDEYLEGIEMSGIEDE